MPVVYKNTPAIVVHKPHIDSNLSIESIEYWIDAKIISMFTTRDIHFKEQVFYLPFYIRNKICYKIDSSINISYAFRNKGKTFFKREDENGIWFLVVPSDYQLLMRIE